MAAPGGYEEMPLIAGRERGGDRRLTRHRVVVVARVSRTTHDDTTGREDTDYRPLEEREKREEASL